MINLLKTLLAPVDDFYVPLLRLLETVGLGTIARRGTWQLVNQAFKSLLRGMYDLHITGRDNIPHLDPAIICTKNPEGLYPFIATLTVKDAVNRMVYQVYDRDYFKVPALKSWLYYSDALLVSNGELDYNTRCAIIDYLKDKHLVGLTLEYVVKTNGEKKMVPNTDIINIARETSVPIIPLVTPNIDGIFSIKSDKFTFNQKIRVTVCEPFTAHLESDDVEGAYKQLKRLFKKVEKEIVHDAPVSPATSG